MVWRSVGNVNEIRPDIKTSALLSRCSTDIYVDICTVSGSNLMSFFHSLQTELEIQCRRRVCYTSAHNLEDLNLQAVQRLIKKINKI